MCSLWVCRRALLLWPEVSPLHEPGLAGWQTDQQAAELCVEPQEKRCGQSGVEREVKCLQHAQTAIHLPFHYL